VVEAAEPSLGRDTHGQSSQWKKEVMVGTRDGLWEEGRGRRSSRETLQPAVGRWACEEEEGEEGRVEEVCVSRAKLTHMAVC
jgi:hypothetical protein